MLGGRKELNKKLLKEMDMSNVGQTLTKEQTKAGWKRLTEKQQRFLDNFMYRDMTQTASDA